MNTQMLIDTARTLVAGDKGLLAVDESNPTCNKRFAKVGIPQTVEARRSRFGEASRPMYWRHSRLCFIAPGATVRRAAANIVVRWKNLGRINARPISLELVSKRRVTHE